jgi:hypothetical protein
MFWCSNSPSPGIWIWDVKRSAQQFTIMHFHQTQLNISRNFPSHQIAMLIGRDVHPALNLRITSRAFPGSNLEETPLLAGIRLNPRFSLVNGVSLCPVYLWARTDLFDPKIRSMFGKS